MFFYFFSCCFLPTGEMKMNIRTRGFLATP